jgi:hypothetical protein
MDLMDLFNNEEDNIRVVAILSPSCKECEKGYKALESIFHSFAPSGKLTGAIIWKAGVENLPDQEKSSSITFVADESGDIVASFAKSVNLQEKELHVYLLYPPRLRWEEDQLPPAPAFWMGELAEKNYFFDPLRFKEEVKFLVEAEDPNFSDVPEALLNKKKHGGST